MGSRLTEENLDILVTANSYLKSALKKDKNRFLGKGKSKLRDRNKISSVNFIITCMHTYSLQPI